MSTMILSGLMNGIGILLLVPMLNAIGLGQDGAPQADSNFVPAWLDGTWNLPTILLLFVTLSAAHAALVRWQTVAGARLKEDVVHLLRNELFEALNRAAYSFLVSRQSSDFSHALTQNLQRVAAGTIQALRLLSTMLVAAAQITATILISPVMSLVTLATGALLWPLLSRRNQAVAVSGRELTSINRLFFSNLADCLGGMKEAKSLCAEDSSIRAFSEQSARIRESHLRMTRAMADTALIYSVGAALLLSGLLYLSRAVLQIPSASLIALVFVFSRILPRLRDIHNGYLHMVHMLPAFDSVMTLTDNCRRNRDSAADPPADRFHLTAGIEFRDVSFRYRSDDKMWALRNVSIQIPFQRMTAIVGPSGAGKSTLADLLLTLFQPTDGEIVVDGQPLTDAQVSRWRRAIGYVPQETYLLHGTIRENLLWAEPQATESELQKALRAAAAWEFVQRLPDGLESIVGDRGVRLSGGERQRIALARALLRRPTLLILDEATSALDAENQQRIKQAIERLRGRMTIVTVAHRLSTIADADHVVVLESGRVAETGPFRQLAGRPDSRLSKLIQADRATSAA